MTKFYKGNIKNVFLKKAGHFFYNVKSFALDFPYFSLVVLAIISLLLMDSSEIFGLLFIVPFLFFCKNKFEELKEISKVQSEIKDEIAEIQQDLLDVNYILSEIKEDKKDPFNEEKNQILKEMNSFLQERVEKLNLHLKNK